MTNRLITLLLSTAGTLHAMADVPAVEFPDTTVLDEVVVTLSAPGRELRNRGNGDFNLSLSGTRYGVSMLGSGDPLALLRTLPAVQTPNDLQAGLCIRGMGYGDNMYELDGARIFNPMHMLGLFSAFNPAFVKDIDISTGHTPANSVGAPGGVLSAKSIPAFYPRTKLTASLGIIESHLGADIPLQSGKGGISFGARQSYLNLLFPDILTVGHSRLGYGFSDLGLSFTAQPLAEHQISASVFYTSDKMSLKNQDNGDKDGDFGWHNAGGAIRWSHKRWNVVASGSTFSNTFVMNEGGRSLSLPSDISQEELTGSMQAGSWLFTAGTTFSQASGQHNANNRNKDDFRRRRSFLEEISATWLSGIGKRLILDAGLRMSAYQTNGFHIVSPQPRLKITSNLSAECSIWLSAGRYMKFDRLIQETSGGLPADFFALATASAKPEDVWSFSMGCHVRLPLGISCSLEGYGRRISNAIEFGGSILDMLNPGYNPENNLAVGKGYSLGLSLMLAKEIGKVRGRLNYNLGKSRLKFYIYENRYLPSASDRPHDLSLNLSYSPVGSITVAATFTHATGLPYTKAKYGYMIEENLICEYYPHNSSRLPSYNRLDLSATWTFLRKGNSSHSLNVSIYNATAARNVLFIYPSFSSSEGIRQNKSIMKSVIPSLTYTFSL